MREQRSMDSPGGPAAKFVFSFIFGCFVSGAVALTGFFWFELALFEHPGVHILWIIPLLWGILGIFFFDKMIRASRSLFEDYFRR